MTLYPVPLLASTEPFCDEPDYTAADKRQILAAWRRFILTGFPRSGLDKKLYSYLRTDCHLTRPLYLVPFWTEWFAADVAHLKAFINQFGGDRRHALDHTHHWLGGPTQDLKLALCEVMTPLSHPLLQLLTDLEQQHGEIVRLWQAFAQHANAQPQPPTYQVSPNTRHLLAYAARIAQQRPLPGLQQVMFSGDN